MSNVRVFAYYALHYGYEWLEHSMRSIAPFCEKIYVFWTYYPSYGHATTLTNPDLQYLDQMKQIAKKHGTTWIDMTDHVNWEGAHRDFAVQTLTNDGADLILVVDEDEIWGPEHLNHAILQASRVPTEVYRVFMRHFWRSLHWVCDDPAAPVRIINPKHKDGREGYIGLDKVFHMGYAQRPELVHYKMSIHGHKNDIRPDWFRNKFMSWRPGNGINDVHPTNVDFWNPAPYEDVDGLFADLVGDHPYYDLEIID